jgi:tRNA-2-methylthio-N6-dimethylallyladenosine synthase
MVGVLGCMAERLKNKLIEAEKMVDLVVGPDAYRDLPRLVAKGKIYIDIIIYSNLSRP